MNIEENLIRYCQIDTQSDPESKTEPSSENVFALAELLKKQLEEIGMSDVYLSKYGYVYASLPANTDKKLPTVAFIAHMDTAPDYSGKNVRPRVIRNYDGKDIRLNPSLVMKTSEFPSLLHSIGSDLLVTDGTTLLGADDKAGIAVIMDALVYLKKHPRIRHGRVAAVFTPDEEIGEGTRNFELKRLKADFAYTIDGDEVSVFADETFNAASAEITCSGFSIHPGSAKDRMINAGNLLYEFHRMLPEEQRPEHTEGREGFFHLHEMEGNVEHARAEYIIRNHDRGQFEKQIQLMKNAVRYINELHGGKYVKIRIDYTYSNMKEVMDKHPEVSAYALTAMKDIGLNPSVVPVRGGTDGSALSFRGLPCPNLGAGGANFHGRYEYCDLNQMKKASELVVQIIRNIERSDHK